MDWRWGAVYKPVHTGSLPADMQVKHSGVTEPICCSSLTVIRNQEVTLQVGITWETSSSFSGSCERRRFKTFNRRLTAPSKKKKYFCYLLRLQLTLIINLLVIFSIYHFVYKNVRKQWKCLKDYVFKSLILSDDNDHSITFEKLNPANIWSFLLKFLLFVNRWINRLIITADMMPAFQ